MQGVVMPGPCADCQGLVAPDEAWAGGCSGCDPTAWGRAVRPHPHLDRAGGTPLRCRACGCCWSLDENPDCGHVRIERLSEREYRRQLRPPRWSPPFREGRWGAMALL